MSGPRTSAAAIAGALLLTGCGGTDLKADDPAGYQACQLYVQSQESDDPVMKVGLPMFEIGDHASEASTEAIRDSVEPLFDTAASGQLPQAWKVDDEALRAACEANGVEIP